MDYPRFIAHADQAGFITHALNEIRDKYGDIVSVANKSKSLLKFGSRTTVGTGWETMMTAQGDEVQETLLATNGITTIVSDDAADTGTVSIQYHTIDTGKLTFGIQEATLNGLTPVTLTIPCARASRKQNTGAVSLVGNVYIYEGGTRSDANTHAFIPAGENQTQKTATSISDSDYLIITSATVNVLARRVKYAEARLEKRKIGDDYWLPMTDTFSASDDTGAITKEFAPYKIVPSNYDVRIAVRTNTEEVEVSGGFSGFLAN